MQYFFYPTVQGKPKALAMVSQFSEPNAVLLKESSGALVVCKYNGSSSLKVIPVSSITSVVGMVPFPQGNGQHFFLVEKLGLEMNHLAGHNEEVREE